jgi:hypothetical protein
VHGGGPGHREEAHSHRLDGSKRNPWMAPLATVEAGVPGASRLMTASPLVTSSVNSANPSYRPDIDGLSAVAVLAVVFYHFRLGMPLEASSGSMSFS